MNRREFLKRVAATGSLLCLGSCVTPDSERPLRIKSFSDGMAIADTHAHPYQFHGNTAPDPTMPTLETMSLTGMVLSSFSAVGDIVKYRGRTGSAFTDTMGQLQAVVRFQEQGRVKSILTGTDISLASASLPGALMAIEGGDALEGKLENLNRFYSLGVRMITLMHYHQNEIGFHQSAAPDGPLTPFGTKVVEKMNEMGMLIDVAHAKAGTLKAIAGVTRAPLIDSHTNPLPVGYEPKEPMRMRSWKEIEIVAETGGMICTWPMAYDRRFHKRKTLKDWAEEVVLMKSRLGIEHCGLGTDGGGHLPKLVQGWASLLSIPDLILSLEAAGMNRDETAAFLGGNFIRLLKTTLA